MREILHIDCIYFDKETFIIIANYILLLLYNKLYIYRVKPSWDISNTFNAKIVP